jgi:hypothetical protein
MAPRNNPAHVAVYQDAVDNIRFSKQQQWRVTNYALLIYAAAYLLRGDAPLNTCGEKAGLTAIVAIVWAFNIFVLCNSQASMKKFRDRIGWFYEGNFTPTERIKLTMVPKSFCFDPTIFLGLLAVTTGAAGIVLSVIWASLRAS